MTGDDSYAIRAGWGGKITVDGGTVNAFASGSDGYGISTSASLVIGDGSEVAATGTVQAIEGNVDNQIAGTGWTDYEGKSEKHLIDKSDGTEKDLSSFKRVRFPAFANKITVAPAVNGNVEADKEIAGEGDTVTLTATPDENYKLKELSVTAPREKIKSIEEMVSLMGDAVFSCSNVPNQYVRIVDGTFCVVDGYGYPVYPPVFNYFDTSESDTGKYLAGTDSYYSWEFTVKDGKIVRVIIYDDDGSYDDESYVFTGESTGPLPTDPVKTTTVKEGEKYTITMPPADVAVSAVFEKKQTVSRTVTFKVANGSWNDGTANAKTVKLTGYEGGTLKLKASDIPAVGQKPNSGYKAGSWDKVPGEGTVITEAAAFTYTYAKKEPTPKPTVKPSVKPTTKPTTKPAVKPTKPTAKPTRPTTRPTSAAPGAKTSGTLIATAKAKGRKSLKITWTKVEGASGYDIFFARCNHHGRKLVCRNVKNIKGNKTFTWKKQGLKKRTAYKVYVKAYVMKKGRKSYVRTSPVVHAYTSKGTKKYTNARSVTVNREAVSLNKGNTFKIEGKVKKVNKKKKLMPKSHTPAVRFMSSNNKVAAVSGGGKITAKGKGTCYVYVYAHNGVFKQIKVTVK